VIQKIDDLGLWDNSIVMFTTDHGMSIGEHERTGKSNINDADERYWPLYPEVAHLPLMIAAPGVAGGREVDEFVQPPDILPTLLELAGVEARPPEPFHGLSFAHMLTEARPQPIRDFAISGSRLPKMRGGAVTPAVYAKQWAYVPVGPEGEEQFFDLAADPYCLTDLASAHADVCRDMRRTLLDWFDSLDAKVAGEPFRA
jgi:arylsulfatase A-like enzyme